ncbi:MAG TPA: outer membrane beta-barrel protein, partial [Vicinamibacterales bacterium]
ALAQGHVNLFVGSNFFGDAGRSVNDAFDDGSRLTWGAAIGGMTKGILGAEVDFGYSHNFFGKDDTLDKNYVLTLMPNVIVGVPIGGEKGPGFQPFASAGFGLLRRSLNVNGAEALNNNGAAYSLGFGVNGYAGTNFGVRADYRYFRNVSADEGDNILGIDFDRGTFSFSRASVGAIFRF